MLANFNMNDDVVTCSSDSKSRLACLRRKRPKDILEPYFKWFCPFNRPKDPWCNRTLAVSDGGGGGRNGGNNALAADTGENSDSGIATPPLFYNRVKGKRNAGAAHDGSNSGSNIHSSISISSKNKPWPDKLPPVAPVAAFIAVVDGTDGGLPDTPYRMMQASVQCTLHHLGPRWFSYALL